MISVFTGPMFSGKTTMLFCSAGPDALYVTHCIDTRSATGILCHNQSINTDVVRTKKTSDIWEIVRDKDLEKYSTIAIDEVQFFDESTNVERAIAELRNMGKIVYVGGLDFSSNLSQFKNTRDVLKIADKSIKLQAICSVCSTKNAIYTKCIVNKPASHGEIFVGGSDVYEPRCEEHFYQERFCQEHSGVVEA